MSDCVTLSAFTPRSAQAGGITGIGNPAASPSSSPPRKRGQQRNRSTQRKRPRRLCSICHDKQRQWGPWKDKCKACYNITPGSPKHRYESKKCIDCKAKNIQWLCDKRCRACFKKMQALISDSSDSGSGHDGSNGELDLLSADRSRTSSLSSDTSTMEYEASDEGFLSQCFDSSLFDAINL